MTRPNLSALTPKQLALHFVESNEATMTARDYMAATRYANKVKAHGVAKHGDNWQNLINQFTQNRWVTK